MSMKIIFFGAGAFARNVLQKIFLDTERYIDEYLALTDNNSRLWGDFLYGIEIINPRNIYEYNMDFIVILSLTYENDIRRQLIDELKVRNEKILTYGEYLRKSYAGWIYRKRYGKHTPDLENSAGKLDSLVVYTAITGNHDKLRDPLFISDDITYVCFTNNRDIKSKIWNIEYMESKDMDDAHLAKHIKLNPQEYFSDYEMSIWVDGKYQVMDDLRKYIIRYQKQSSILCFPHPERQCICDEVAACILWTNANKRDMIIQVSDYLQEGYPMNHGLYEGGCIVRRHNDIHIKKLMKKWEGEIVKYSIRDQLSFPYVCWKTGILPDICDLDINRNPWLLQRRTLY